MEKKEEKKPGRGRPVKEENKLIRSINLKLTEADYEKICERAATIGLKPTQYARQMALKGQIRSRYTKKELALRRTLSGEGNNLNQLTKRANTSGFGSCAAEIMEVIDRLKKILDDSEKH